MKNTSSSLYIRRLQRQMGDDGLIYYCSKKHFYNIIVMFRDMGSIAYYVNIATPTMPLEKENEYGFIDLDLDVKLTEDKKIKILDQDEFEKNGEKYNYSEKLKKVSQDSVKVICEMIKENHPYFSDDYNRNKLNKYMESYRNVLGNKNI